MLFKKLKRQIIWLFKNLILSWYREVLVLHNLEMEELINGIYMWCL